MDIYWGSHTRWNECCDTIRCTSRWIVFLFPLWNARVSRRERRNKERKTIWRWAIKARPSVTFSSYPILIIPAIVLRESSVSSDLGIIHTCWIQYRMKNLVREPSSLANIRRRFSCLSLYLIFQYLYMFEEEENILLSITPYNIAVRQCYVYILAIELLSGSGSFNLLIIIIKHHVMTLEM